MLLAPPPVVHSHVKKLASEHWLHAQDSPGHYLTAAAQAIIMADDSFTHCNVSAHKDAVDAVLDAHAEHAVHIMASARERGWWAIVHVKDEGSAGSGNCLYIRGRRQQCQRGSGQ